MCTMSLCTVRCAHVIVQPATPLHLPVSGPESSHHHMSGCKPAGECKQMVLILSVWIDSNHNDATCLILCGSFVIAPNYHLAIHCNKWQQFDLHKKRWYLQINEMSSQSQWTRFLVSASEHSSGYCHYFLSWMYRQQWWYLKMISADHGDLYAAKQPITMDKVPCLIWMTISWTGGKHFLGAMMATQKVIKTLILEFPKRFLGICQLLFEFC